MMVRPRVFAVVLNWNLRDDTIACVESVLASSYSRLSVIVVDNASTDDSVEVIRDHFGDKVELLTNHQNVGFAAGVNVGIQRALAGGADWVLLLNNDTVIAADMVERLVTSAARVKGAGILAPAIFYHDSPHKLWRLGDRQLSWMPIPVPVTRMGNADVIPVDYVTGCGMLIRREVFSAIGLFDSSYYMYYEDADFCRRARQAGFGIACIPAARMWHKVSKSTQRNIYRQRYLKSRYRMQFYKRNYSPVAWSYVGLSAVWMVALDLLRGKWEAARAEIQGMVDGWRSA